MPTDPKALLIAAQLRLAAGYLRDSRLLSANGSRNAVNLLFQAAEAALIALMTAEGEHAGRDIQHQLGAMTDKLPDANPLKPLFAGVSHLTGYATTFRYATAAGRVRAGPVAVDLASWQANVKHILGLCASWFGLSLSDDTASPTARTNPPRGLLLAPPKRSA